MSPARIRWALLLVYCAAIFWESSQSTLPAIAPLENLLTDKVLHAGAFAVFAIMACEVFRFTVPAWRTRWWAVGGWVVSAVYGASDEIHQRFTPGRSADPYDWLADMIGALLACAVYFLVMRRRRGRTLRWH